MQCLRHISVDDTILASSTPKEQARICLAFTVDGYIIVTGIQHLACLSRL